MKWLGLAIVSLVLVPFLMNSRGKAVGSIPARSAINHSRPTTTSNAPAGKKSQERAMLEQAQLQLLIYQARLQNQGVAAGQAVRPDQMVRAR